MTASTSTRPRFFEDLGRFGDATAIIDTTSGETLSYRQLDSRIEARKPAFDGPRGLAFFATSNDACSLVDYLACLQSGHVAHLLDSLDAPMAQDLIAHYLPNYLVDAAAGVRRTDAPPMALHPDLLVLLSTSGSTGSPKLVKLSAANLHSNAKAIAEYLELGGSERAMQHLKPHYSYGLSIINSHLFVGATLVLTHLGVAEPAFWQAFRDHKATSFAGVPYTFETLKHLKFDPSAFPDLRYATQAGGRLSADLVHEFASAFNSCGKRFFVMYGQTEAAPRMSYLPPELAVRHPGSIGRAIPKGELFVVDADGNRIATPDTPGELAYAGPNVMMGYASGPAELATEETRQPLLTGDIAVTGEDGLFFITGRTSRFVKLFGLRVNLDEVQAYVQTRCGTCAVAGNDAVIAVAIECSPTAACPVTSTELAQKFGLVDRVFNVKRYESLPLLANGKIDYQNILEAAAGHAAPTLPLIIRMLDGIRDILGLNPDEHDSVEAVFSSVLGDPHPDMNARVGEMALDSLSFVSLSVELEDLFGDRLPDAWQTLTLGELEARYQAIVGPPLS